MPPEGMVRQTPLAAVRATEQQELLASTVIVWRDSGCKIGLPLREGSMKPTRSQPPSLVKFFFEDSLDFLLKPPAGDEGFHIKDIR